LSSRESLERKLVETGSSDRESLTVDGDWNQCLSLLENCDDGRDLLGLPSLHWPGSLQVVVTNNALIERTSAIQSKLPHGSKRVVGVTLTASNLGGLATSMNGLRAIGRQCARLKTAGMRVKHLILGFLWPSHCMRPLGACVLPLRGLLLPYDGPA
jgi:hypothetical protein